MEVYCILHSECTIYFTEPITSSSDITLNYNWYLEIIMNSSSNLLNENEHITILYGGIICYEDRYFLCRYINIHTSNLLQDNEIAEEKITSKQEYYTWKIKRL